MDHDKAQHPIDPSADTGATPRTDDAREKPRPTESSREKLGIGGDDLAAAKVHNRHDRATVEAVGSFSGILSTLPTKQFFSDRVDRWLFLIFAGIGIAIISVAKLAVGGSGLITALPPVAILCGYALLVRGQVYFRLHPDRLGDNCYYMGFIFTLTSLSVALIQLEDAGENARAALLETLIGNFGIALSSTIVGIALRVFFIQFRREIEDEEEQVREDLHKTAAALKDGLGLAVSDMENFRLRVVQVVNEQLLSAAKEFGRVQADLARMAMEENARYTETQKRMADRLDQQHVSLMNDVDQARQLISSKATENFEQLSEMQRSTTVSLGEVAGSVSSSVADLGANTNKVVVEMRKLVTRVERIEAPPDLLVRHVRSAEGQIKRLSDALEILVQHDNQRATAFGVATEAMLKHLSVAADTSKLEHFEQAVDGLQRQIGLLNNSMTQYQQAIDGLAQKSSQEHATLSTMRQGIEQDAKASAEALHALQATLVDIARGITQKLGGD